MNNTAQEEKLDLKDFLNLAWKKAQPYRLGFLLGLVSVSLTLILILTGQKSERLDYATKSPPYPQNTPDDKVLNQATKAAQIETLLNKTTQAPVTKIQKIFKGQININTASISQLESLPYIGPVTAQRIIDFRQSHGPFKSIEALDLVKGIGPKTIEKLRPLITIDGQ